MGLRSFAICAQSFFDAYLNEFRRRWTMHVCTIVFSRTALTAPGRPFSPSQTSMHTSRTPRFLISGRTRSQYLAVAVLARPQAHDVALAVHGDAQGQADGPVGDLALADLHVNSVDENHGVNRSSGRDCQSAVPSMTRSVIVV